MSITYVILLGLLSGFYKLLNPDKPWWYALGQTFIISSFIIGGNLFAWLVGIGEKTERKAGIYSAITVFVAVLIVFTAIMCRFHIIIVAFSVIMGIFAGLYAASTNRDLKKQFLPNDSNATKS